MGWGLARDAYLDAVSDQCFHLWLGSHWGLPTLVRFFVNGRRLDERARLRLRTQPALCVLGIL